MTQTKRPATQAGFTLVEVLIAALVIGLGLVPLVWFISVSHHATRLTIDEVMASNLATELLEAVQALPFDLVGQMDATTPGDPYAGDIVRDGVVQTQLLEQTFRPAIGAGFLLKIPEFPKGWHANLIIRRVPTTLERPLPADLSAGLRVKADEAREYLAITVRVSWPASGAMRQIILMTARTGV